MMRRATTKTLRSIFSRRPFWAIALSILVSMMASACAFPQVSAEDRLFLKLSLDYVDEFQMPKQTYEGATVGGLSAIAYDRSSDRFYALSDDRGESGPVRFYTLHLSLDQEDPVQPRIDDVVVEAMTPLRTETGEPFPVGTVDPEGIALSPQNTLLISSEGVARDGIPPFIDEFDLSTGERLRQLPIPQRYVPEAIDEKPLGIQDNRGFEALTLSAAGMGAGRLEPFRVFAALEEPLHQDLGAVSTSVMDGEDVEPLMPSRMLHYIVGDDQATLIAEHLYPIDPKPLGAVINGLAELMVIDQAGHFLSLERSFGVLGAGAKLFQVAIANATDTSQIETFDTIDTIQPVYKQLILDLSELGIPLENLEGMTLGPQLADGSQSLILVSDDNFNDSQATQWLLFRFH